MYGYKIMSLCSNITWYITVATLVKQVCTKRKTTMLYDIRVNAEQVLHFTV